jgi:hypothetical protein
LYLPAAISSYKFDLRLIEGLRLVQMIAKGILPLFFSRELAEPFKCQRRETLGRPAIPAREKS